MKKKREMMFFLRRFGRREVGQGGQVGKICGGGEDVGARLWWGV